MKRPVPTPLAAALLLAFSGHALAIDVASEADYIDAITGSHNNITILNDIGFTGIIPDATVASGLVLQGQSGQNTTLTGNATSGALRTDVTTVTSAIRDLTFQNFLTTDSLRGGAAYSGKLLGSISNTKFVNNTATSDNGGAIYLRPDSSVTVDGGTRFVGNEAGRGAGIYAASIASLHIKDTTFIGNRAVGTATLRGYGGAVAAWGNDIFMGNITVLGNTGKDAGTGCNLACAAAIVHGNNDADPASVVFSAANGNDTLIYGNQATDTGAYRALYLGHATPDPTITNFVLTADSASRLLLLDSLKDEHHDTFTVNVKKEGAGTWYQGGVSEMGSRNIWNLDAGTLALTTVTYDGINDVAARINLTNTNAATFNLNSGATLAGSGTIQAKDITLSGILDPGVYRNTGLNAVDMAAAIVANGDLSQAQIDSIGVNQTSGYGTLTFDGNVAMAGATYNVDIDVDGNQNDVLDIAGALTVTGVTTINVKTLNYASPTVPDHSQDFYTVVSKVIKTTGGITGAEHIGVTAAGVDLTGKGFLQARGQVDSTGNNYDLYLGLRWKSNRLDDTSGDHDAHGFFDIDGVGNTFTLNVDLADRNDALFAGTSNAHGWDGMTLIKTGDGTLVLGGTNTYSGGTTVNAGVLDIAGTTDGLVDVNNSAHVLVSGTLQGDANVNHNATLTVNGTLQGSATVASGATLTGTGTLQGDAAISGFLRGTQQVQGHVTMLVGSTLAPGFSIGTLQAAQHTFTPGSVYEVEINEAGQSDLLDVDSSYGVGDGTVTIGNNVTLRVLADATATTSPVLWQPNTTYDIITTENGVTGTFATIDNHLAFLTAQADYSDPLKVRLLMTRNGAQFGTGGTFCTQFNQCATGNGLDALEAQNGNHPLILAMWQLGASQMPAALENLSGEIYASTRAALLRDRHLRDAVMRRARTQTQAGTHLWVDTWAQNGHIRGDANAAQAAVSGYGLALGVDTALAENAKAGAFLAYEDSKVKNGSTRNSRSDVDGVSAGVYAAANPGRVQLSGGVTYSRLDIDTRRDISVAHIQSRVQSKGKGRKVQAFAEAAVPFALSDSVTVAPYVGLAQTWLRTNDAHETGNVAALDIARQTDSTCFTTLGVRAAVALPTARPASLTFDAGWVRALGDVESQTQNRFSGTNAGFASKGVGVGKNAALAGVGVQAQLSDKAALNLGYQGQFGSGTTNHAARLQVGVQF